MTEELARALAGWRYSPPYDFYDGADADVAGMLDPVNGYRGVRLNGEFVGYVCAGPDARVAGQVAMDRVDDIGLGFRPDLTGRGIASAWVPVVIGRLTAQLSAPVQRVVIAAWNERSRAVALRAGFDHPILHVNDDGEWFVLKRKVANTRRNNANTDGRYADMRSRPLPRPASGSSERPPGRLSSGVVHGGAKLDLVASVTARATLIVVEPSSDLGMRALRAYFEDIVGRYWGWSLTEAELESALEESPSDDLVAPSGLLIVAEIDGQTVGCGGVRFVSDEFAELTRIHVTAAARRRGVAAQMIGYFEQQAFDRGAGVMRLDVRGDLTEALALYRRLGYREVPPFNTHPYVGHWFEKTLNREAAQAPG
jgi:GNAT superfamily N-acetyltransferase